MVCEIGYTLVLYTTRKSHTGFRSVPSSVTLSDHERPTGRHHELVHTIRQLCTDYVKFTEAIDPYCQQQKTSLPKVIWVQGRVAAGCSRSH